MLLVEWIQYDDSIEPIYSVPGRNIRLPVEIVEHQCKSLSGQSINASLCLDTETNTLSLNPFAGRYTVIIDQPLDVRVGLILKFIVSTGGEERLYIYELMDYALALNVDNVIFYRLGEVISVQSISNVRKPSRVKDIFSKVKLTPTLLDSLFGSSDYTINEFDIKINHRPSLEIGVLALGFCLEAYQSIMFYGKC